MAGAMTAACVSCGGRRDVGSRSGRCRACWVTKRPDRFCGCGAKLGRPNKSGLCKLCVCRRNHENPELRAKMVIAARRSNADPVLREKRAMACKAACGTAAERQRRRELGRRNAHLTVLSPKARARAFSPEAVAMRAAARSATMAERRAAKLEREAQLNALADLTPFERQLAKVRAGAGIVELKPITRPDAHSFTGSSLSMTVYG